jgi:hypothetical protein
MNILGLDLLVLFVISTIAFVFFKFKVLVVLLAIVGITGCQENAPGACGPGSGTPAIVRGETPASAAKAPQAQLNDPKDLKIYGPLIELRNVQARRSYDKRSLFVTGEVKNRSDKAFNDVEIVVTLLDANGRGVQDVLASLSPASGGTVSLLKPNFTGPILGMAEAISSDWKGPIEAKVTGLKFNE